MNDGSLPPGFTVDPSDDDSPGLDALPPGFKVDTDSVDDESAPPPPFSTTKKSYEITDPAEAGAAARAYDPRGGETGFHPLHALGTLGSIAAQSASGAGQSLINIGSKLVGADPAAVTRKLGLGSPNDLLTPDAAALEKGIADSPTGQDIRRGVQYADNALGKISPTAQSIAHEAAGDIQDIGNVAGVTSLAAGPVSRVISGAGDLAKAGIAREAATLNVPSEPVPPPVRPASDAQAVLAQHAANSPQSMGAAAAAPSLEGTSPELQHVIANSTNPNMEAARRQADAETLPLPDGQEPARLTKGLAARDGQQQTDEVEFSKDKGPHATLLQNAIDKMDQDAVASMGEIRARANPTIVHRTTAQHGQTGVDAIKAQDNATTLEKRAAYKDLEDAAGGVMPIDTGATAEGIDSTLEQKLNKNVAYEDPTIREIMDALKSGKPMTFERFNDALKNLSALQRLRTPISSAATVVRNGLESMPLTQEWAHLKGLRDKATSIAKRQFDTEEQNPAYSAAVNDGVPKDQNGLHVIGAPSPVADKFMNTYFLGDTNTASLANILNMQKVMRGNEHFAPAVEASVLNKLSDAAGINEKGEGKFNNATFQKTHRVMSGKFNAMLQPETIDNVDHLRRYSEDINWRPKSTGINWSGTAAALRRYGAQFPEAEVPTSQGRAAAGTLADVGTDIMAAHTGAPGFIAARLGKNAWRMKKEKLAQAQREAQEQSVQNAKLKFAQDATAPGAGIDTPAPTPPVTGRASGGRVDHEALVNRLFTRWKQAQKESDRVTEPLLTLPDEAITKALRIAQSRATI